MIFNHFDEMLEILDRLKDAEDPVVSAYAHSQLVFYYTGWFHPPVDVNLAKHHYNQAKQIIDSYEFKDDWEKSFLLSIFLHSQSILEEDVEKRIEMIENLRENNRKLPEYGEEFSYYQEVAYAQFFHQNGMFDEAIRSYEKVIELTGKDLIVFAYTGMANVSIKQAAIDKACNYSEKNIQVAQQGNNPFLMRLAYNIHAHILEISGELDQALIFLNKSLLLSREMSNSVFIAMDISDIFSFFMRRFSLSSDKQFLERAREMNHNLKELELSQENETITRLSKLSDAMLLKLGSVRSKAKAIDLIEERITQYPKGFDMFYRTVDRTINLKVHLIELYMQDLEFDHTGESKRQIDILIEEISESPLFKNPNTIAEYSDFQIIVARYKYYVEGDINGAFSLLEELASYTEHFGLQSVKKKIEFHINYLQQDVSKWKDVDISIQNRIKQSQIKDYIKKALETSRQDLTLD